MLLFCKYQNTGTICPGKHCDYEGPYEGDGEDEDGEEDGDYEGPYEGDGEDEDGEEDGDYEGPYEGDGGDEDGEEDGDYEGPDEGDGDEDEEDGDYEGEYEDDGDEVEDYEDEQQDIVQKLLDEKFDLDNVGEVFKDNLKVALDNIAESDLGKTILAKVLSSDFNVKFAEHVSDTRYSNGNKQLTAAVLTVDYGDFRPELLMSSMLLHELVHVAQDVTNSSFIYDNGKQGNNLAMEVEAYLLQSMYLQEMNSFETMTIVKSGNEYADLFRDIVIGKENISIHHLEKFKENFEQVFNVGNVYSNGNDYYRDSPVTLDQFTVLSSLL